MNQSIHLGRMSNNLAVETGNTRVVTQPAKHRIILVEWHATSRIRPQTRDPKWDAHLSLWQKWL